jgi:hypothetical protein
MEYPNLALIRQGIEYRFIIKLRGASFVMRPLSIMEEDLITQEVIDAMKDLDQPNKTSIRESSLMCVKKLARGNTSDFGKNDGKIHEIELQKLTAGELDNLFKQYVAGCDKLNPLVDEFSKDQVLEWISILKKNTKDLGMTLTELSFFQLAALCQHLLTTEGLPEDK